MSTLQVRDLTSRAHFSTIFSTFTFIHEEDNCYFSTCFFISVWGESCHAVQCRAVNARLSNDQ